MKAYTKTKKSYKVSNSSTRFFMKKHMKDLCSEDTTLIPFSLRKENGSVEYVNKIRKETIGECCFPEKYNKLGTSKEVPSNVRFINLESITKKNSLVGVHRLSDKAIKVGYQRTSNADNVVIGDVSICRKGVEIEARHEFVLGRVKLKTRLEELLISLSGILDTAIEVGGVENVKKCLPHGFCQCEYCYSRERMIELLNSSECN